METKYVAMFPSKTGHPATPFRMALGVLIIQKRKKLSDRAVIKEIQENPYLQYFLGMEKFSHQAPIKPSVMVSFRKRLAADYLMEVNEYILEISGITKVHELKNESKNAKAANTRSDDLENLGTEILDATYSPSNIRYPQDFSLLNEAREKLEDMIDYFHKNYHPWDKPRTYRRIARKEYLALAKSKKRTEKKIRATLPSGSFTNSRNTCMRIKPIVWRIVLSESASLICVRLSEEKSSHQWNLAQNMMSA